ncbi:MAG: integrase arm-type DNA-binding domain-containing protein [Hyphomonadaceae bacterium]|nr:integrase arm-type DNA-binding domain-containing protein [Hyphomonadaceae bacterium]
MPLTEPQVRSAKPASKPFKLYDSEGLFLFVTPSGGKLWRYRFKFDDKEKVLALGAYPKLGLAAARKKRNTAIEAVQAGVDPTAERREAKAARAQAKRHTFKAVALEWHDLHLHEWTPSYAKQIMNRLEADVFPKIGGAEIADIKPAKMLEVLKAVEARGVLETNRRLKQYCSAIFRFGIASQYCEHDAAAPLKGALKPPPRPKHHKALARSQVGDFLIRLAAYDGEPETRIGINLALLMAPRTTELRASLWTEIENLESDKEDGLWRVPVERMKMSQPHLVPLARQTRALLLELKKLTGKSRYLFPSDTAEGFMSNNTMLFALYRLGFHGRTTTHGFRRLFSTEANEHGWNEDWVERQLAHDERNRSRAAYNAAQYLPQRREMMQWWADHLDALRDAEVARRASQLAAE